MALGWYGGWHGDWYGSWYGARHGIHTITDTDILQKPIDAILAGQQDYKFSYREYTIQPRNARESVSIKRSGARRLKGDPTPSFTTKTGKKGYD